MHAMSPDLNADCQLEKGENMSYRQKLEEIAPKLMSRPWWAMSIATRDFSKTAGSVWGISLVNINSLEKYTKYFGEPNEGNLAFDNVAPWHVEGLTTLSDVAGDLVDVVGCTNPVIVTYNVPDWSLPLWESMCEESPVLKSMGASLLDLRSVYYSIVTERFEFSGDETEEPYKMFHKSKLNKKFGLLSMAEYFGLSIRGEGMPPDQPAAKALLTKKVFNALLDMDYPDEKESEA